MKKRTAATGAGAVGLAAFGLWMFDGFGEFGLPTAGNGAGENLTFDPTADDAGAEGAPPSPFETASDINPADSPADSDAAIAADPSYGLGPVEDDANAPPIAVADVLVDGSEYHVVRRFASDGRPIREPMTLAQVLAFADSVPGSPEGLKVRVSRTGGALAGAATDLTAALTREGFEEDEIDYRTTYVEGDGGAE